MSYLTEHETEIIQLIARGWGNKQIGWEFGISPKTVSAHINNIKRKLGADTRGQMIVHAVALCLVPLPAKIEVVKRINYENRNRN